MDEPIRLWRAPDAPDWRQARIDRDSYASHERLAAELERVFGAHWLLAGRLDQLRAVGDYCTFEIGGESLLLVNAGEPGIRAYHNVCRHRGRRVVDEGSAGQVRSFRCPYHSWTYGLDGHLRAVADVETFPGLDMAGCGLRPVPVATWQELVFVSFAANGPPLLAYLDVLPDCLAHAFTPAVLVTERVYDLAANWKTALEAFIETNHIASLHPQVARSLEWSGTAVAHFARHSMTAVPAARARDWAARRRGDWRAWIADPAYVEYHYSIFPNVSIHVFLWGLTFLFRALPHPTDPQRCRLDVWAWKRLAPGETPPAKRSMPDAMLGVLEQDYANIPHVQRGVASRGFAGPILGPAESRIGHLHAVLQQVLAPR